MRFGGVLLLLLGVLLNAPVFASDFIGLRGKISAVRESEALLMNNNNFNRKELRQQLKDRVDAVSRQINKTPAPAGKESQLKELRDLWKDYTKTFVMVPVIDSNRQADVAKAITDVQRMRMLQMQRLLIELCR